MPVKATILIYCMRSVKSLLVIPSQFHALIYCKPCSGGFGAGVVKGDLVDHHAYWE